MPINNYLKMFEELPKDLKPADYIDLLLFLLKEKPCVRLGNNSLRTYKNVAIWCENNDIDYIISKEGFMYISFSWLCANITQIVDDSVFNHTYLLGKLLGYPTCCSKKIANIGETNIDSYERHLISNCKFLKPYDLISPKGYLEGYSLISHIPCCTTCKESLRIAEKVYNVININQNNPMFEKWKLYWFNKA